MNKFSTLLTALLLATNISFADNVEMQQDEIDRVIGEAIHQGLQDLVNSQQFLNMVQSSSSGGLLVNDGPAMVIKIEDDTGHSSSVTINRD